MLKVDCAIGRCPASPAAYAGTNEAKADSRCLARSLCCFHRTPAGRTCEEVKVTAACPSCFRVSPRCVLQYPQGLDDDACGMSASNNQPPAKHHDVHWTGTDAATDEHGEKERGVPWRIPSGKLCCSGNQALAMPL